MANAGIVTACLFASAVARDVGRWMGVGAMVSGGLPRSYDTKTRYAGHQTVLEQERGWEQQQQRAFPQPVQQWLVSFPEHRVLVPASALVLLLPVPVPALGQWQPCWLWLQLEQRLEWQQVQGQERSAEVPSCRNSGHGNTKDTRVEKHTQLTHMKISGSPWLRVPWAGARVPRCLLRPQGLLLPRQLAWMFVLVRERQPERRLRHPQRRRGPWPLRQ